jgi:hypothetical protein
MDGYDWIEIVGKQKFAGWVRKQVDLINIVQSNRYGFPVVSALPTEGVPKASTIRFRWRYSEIVLPRVLRGLFFVDLFFMFFMV